MIQTHQYKKQYAEFKIYISARKYAGLLTTYCTPIAQLLEWLEQKNISNIKEVNTMLLVEYYEHLSTRPNKRRGGTLSQSTISSHLFSLHLFFNYLLDTNAIKSGFNIPKFFKQSSEQRQSLSIEQVKQLYESCKSKLEVALLSAAYGCGLRRSEMQQLNTQDIQYKSGMLIVVSGKNSKRREVPMSDGVIRDLKEYFINERSEYLKDHNKHNPAFFVNNKGKRMDGGYMNTLLKFIVERTNDSELIRKGITLHSLRHSIAENLIERGASIDFVKEFLGHSDIDTSFIYAVKMRNKKTFEIK